MAELCFSYFVHCDCVLIYIFIFHHRQCASDWKDFTFVKFTFQLFSSTDKSLKDEMHLLYIPKVGSECKLNSRPDGSQLEHLNGIQWSWVQISLMPTFYSYFKESFGAEYHKYYQFIPLHLCDYLNKTLIKIHVPTDKGNSQKLTLNKR